MIRVKIKAGYTAWYQAYTGGREPLFLIKDGDIVRCTGIVNGSYIIAPDWNPFTYLVPERFIEASLGA